METPTRAHILSRLCLATNPLLLTPPSASLLADFPRRPFPSLPDLLSQSGGLSLRCPSCKAPLLRGFDALLCWSCGAPQQQAASALPPVDWRSSLAFQRLLDALDLQSLVQNDVNITIVGEGVNEENELKVLEDSVKSEKSGSDGDNISQLDFGDSSSSKWQTVPSGKANEMVELFLAQMHDLSFMLSDRLLFVDGKKTGHTLNLDG